MEARCAAPARCQHQRTCNVRVTCPLWHQTPTQAHPVDIFEYPSTPPEYLRVTAAGALDAAHTQYIGPRPRSVVGGSQVGYVVITPLIDAATGRAVLVNRGWVPTAWRDAEGRQEAERAQRAKPGGWGRAEPQVCEMLEQHMLPACQQATTNIEGVVMRSEARNSFVPDNLPDRGEWFWIDAPALAAAAGLPHDTPLVEAVTTQDGAGSMQRGTVPTAMDILGGRTRLPGGVQETFPLAKHVETFMHFHVTPQDHLHYALTWFALAGCTGYMAYRAVRGKR